MLFKMRMLHLLVLAALCLSGGLLLFASPANAAASFGTETVFSAATPKLVPASTTTALSVSPNPAVLSNNITLTATVTTGTGTPTGTVTFKDGISVLATVNLNNAGVAVLVTSNLTLGLHSLTATYNGTLAYSPSISTVVVELVVDHLLTGTLTGLTSSLNPSTVGQSVTFTAVVTSAGVVTGNGPTGTVTFKDGSTTIANLPLPNGSNTIAYTISNLPAGIHPITAQYNGDTLYAGSTSVVLSQVINNSQAATPTTTSLTSTPNPAILNGSVTFTATVAPTTGSGTPSGNVVFRDGNTDIGTASIVVSGGKAVAVLTYSNLSIGLHFITASYAGDTTYTASTSSLYSQTVLDATILATSTTLTSSTNPSPVNQNLTFTASVTAASGTPTGTVTFLDGTTSIGTGTLNASGLAVLNISSLNVGTHPITARYEGATGFSGSTSSVLNEQINNSNLLAATVTLSSTPNPAHTGQSVTLSVTVRNAGGASTPVPSGLVTFKDGANSLGSVTLDASGNASLVVSTLSNGSHDLTASYGGDTNYASNLSNTINQLITNLLTTNTALSVSPNPAMLNQSVTFTATVSPTVGSGTPTGMVTFKEGLNVLGTANLNSSGVATFSTSGLMMGFHTVYASYGGDSTYALSNSSPVTLTVINGSLLLTTTALVSSANPSALGQSVTFTATVTPQTGTQAPTGTVTFMDGSLPLGTTNLVSAGSSSQASFSISLLSVGTHSITAQYSGDGTYSNNVSSALSQVVRTMAECMVVSSGLDDLSCGTLRDAIALANTQIGSQPMTITVSTASITLSSPLPVITNNGSNPLMLMGPCSLDSMGRGLPGTKLVRAANATFSEAGLSLTNNITVRGFALGNFGGYGFAINGNNNVLSCNWIGTTDGMTANPNAGGIQIQGSNNLLGGSSPSAATGNLISGNLGLGISVESGKANSSGYSWVGLAKDGTSSANLRNKTGALRVNAAAQLKLTPGNRF